MDQLRDYILENKRCILDYVRKELPRVHVVASQATYLLWLDCSAYGDQAKEIAAFIRRETGLYLSAGEQYGGNGEHFMRMNLACPRSRVQDGLERLKKGLDAYSKKQ